MGPHEQEGGPNDESPVAPSAASDAVAGGDGGARAAARSTFDQLFGVSEEELRARA